MRDINLNPVERIKILIQTWDEIIAEYIREKFPKFIKASFDESYVALGKDLVDSDSLPDLVHRVILIEGLYDSLLDPYRNIKPLDFLLSCKSCFYECYEIISTSKERKELDLTRVGRMVSDFENLISDLDWRISHGANEKRRKNSREFYHTHIQFGFRRDKRYEDYDDRRFFASGFLGFLRNNRLADTIKIRVFQDEIIKLKTLPRDLEDYFHLKSERRNKKLSENEHGFFSAIRPFEEKNLELTKKNSIQDAELAATEVKLKILEHGQGLLQRELKNLSSENQNLKSKLNDSKLKKRAFKDQLEELTLSYK